MCIEYRLPRRLSLKIISKSVESNHRELSIISSAISQSYITRSLSFKEEETLQDIHTFEIGCHVPGPPATPPPAK